MRQFGRFLGLFASVFVLLSTPAMAMTSQQTDSLTVTAVVPPHKLVYVSAGMKITKIISNTDQDAAPRFFLSSSPAQELTITPELYDQYSQIQSRFNLNQIGEVYNQAWQKQKSVEQPLFSLGHFDLNIFKISRLF